MCDSNEKFNPPVCSEDGFGMMGLHMLAQGNNYYDSYN